MILQACAIASRSKNHYHVVFFIMMALVGSTTRTCTGFILPADGPHCLSRTTGHTFAAGESSSTNDEKEASFDGLGLPPDLISAIPWTRPTPIQALAIPQTILGKSSNQEGISVWAEAPTGSGKTLVFAACLLQKLFYQGRSKNNKNMPSAGMIRSLVLCPTRELAVQIEKAISKLARKANRSPKIVLLHGGVPIGPQLNALTRDQEGAIDIVVATPGRLVDILNKDAKDRADTNLQYKVLKALDNQSKKGDGSLSLQQLKDLELVNQDSTSVDDTSNLHGMLQGLQYLVLDEADRLLSRAFDSEMDGVLKLIQSERPVPTWLFSATFPKAIEPKVDQLFRRLGHTEPPIRISCMNLDRVSHEESVSATLQKRLDRTKTTQSGTQLEQVGPASTIQLRTIRVEKPYRTMALRQLLEKHPEWDRVLVFCGTRYSSEHVARKLRRVGFTAAELHGKLDQEARSRRLRSFVSGKNRVLLCTDLVARGLDINELPAVVNYDLPRSTTDFVHRVGRTGRAGHVGTAVTFCTPETEAHLDLIESRHLADQVARETLPGLEPNEDEWAIRAEAFRMTIDGVKHSEKGLTHDRMFGGIKGKRKSKKDRLREKASRAAALEKGAGAHET